MKKETKMITGIVLAVVIILALVWVVYQSVKSEPANINAVNELPNENMGFENEVNYLSDNVVANETAQNEIANEVVNEVSDETSNDKQEATENDNSSSGSESEVVSGTTTSREEKAVGLAKQYYEEEYGSADEVYFICQEINSDGRYIVRAGNADSGTNMFLYVNIDKGEVSEN